MIRFIDTTDQIDEGERSFSFYDTIKDHFVILAGSSSWEFLEDFIRDYEAAWKDSNHPEAEKIYAMLPRYVQLVPEWFKVGYNGGQPIEDESKRLRISLRCLEIVSRTATEIEVKQLVDDTLRVVRDGKVIPT